MKKTLLILSLIFIGYYSVNAQCTPDPQYANESFGAWPDTIENFPPAYINELYQEVLDFKIPNDAGDIDPTFSGVPIDSFQVSNVAGLPPGLSYACNSQTPAPCTFLGGTQGCALISGTPTQEGVFEIVIYGKGFVTLPFVGPFDQDVDFTGYRIEVLGDGVNSDNLSYRILKPSVNVFPNPASNFINFEVDNVSIGNILIFDITGRQLDNIIVNKTMTSVNTTGFNSGIYFYQLIDSKGDLVQTGKFNVVK
jgi:hypothetical protein